MQKRQHILWKTFYSQKLNYKKIYLDSGESMETWVEENRHVILNNLYDELPSFLDDNSETRMVLKIIIKPKGHVRIAEFTGLAFEFMLVRTELDETISGLLKHFEDIEEYEKCAELVKMKRKYEDSLIQPIKKATKRKYTKKEK